MFIQIKDNAYIINLDEYKSIGARWIDSYVNDGNVTYVDSFGVEYIPKEVRKFIGKKKYHRKYLQTTVK